ncbi:hypothetical protein [Micromonospora psammae]|uniref:hypothetical protein n=1 Tax=Micromonospora sp. CPCC 205556 TaxID=3122398 RepID=UPI002FF2DCC1
MDMRRHPAGLPGDGLRISFSYPTGPFAAIYQSSRLRLLLNGEERAVSGWGTHDFLMPPGPCVVSVRVIFGDTEDFGVAENTFVVVKDETLTLEYLAPRVPGLSGVVRKA